MPKRIQLSRARGWRMPPGAVKVDRSTRFGNPYKVGACARDQAHAVELYRDWLHSEAGERLLALAKERLTGKDLACWCKPGTPCRALTTHQDEGDTLGDRGVNTHVGEDTL